MVILILPSSRCHKPCMRRPHCSPKAARSRLMPTLLNPYRLRKVMRNPNPMKIMTWTSWNTGVSRGGVSSPDYKTGPCFVSGALTLALAKCGCRSAWSDEWSDAFNEESASYRFYSLNGYIKQLTSFLHDSCGLPLMTTTKSSYK